jgi:hypothetical protein
VIFQLKIKKDPLKKAGLELEYFNIIITLKTHQPEKNRHEIQIF